MSRIQDALHVFSAAFRDIAICIERYEQSMEQFKFSLKKLAEALGDDATERDNLLWAFHTKMQWLQQVISTETFEEWMSECFGLSMIDLQAILNRKAREALENRINELRSLPYREYLQSPEWKERVALARQRAGYRCQVCNATNVRLNAHYRTKDACK